MQTLSGEECNIRWSARAQNLAVLIGPKLPEQIQNDPRNLNVDVEKGPGFGALVSETPSEGKSEGSALAPEDMNKFKRRRRNQNQNRVFN